LVKGVTLEENSAQFACRTLADSDTWRCLSAAGSAVYPAGFAGGDGDSNICYTATGAAKK
jgi:hypothetical protein